MKGASDGGELKVNRGGREKLTVSSQFLTDFQNLALLRLLRADDGGSMSHLDGTSGCWRCGRTKMAFP